VRFRIQSATRFTEIASVAMAMAGMGYWSLVGLAVAPAIAKSAAAWIALRWVPSLPSRGNGVKSMLKFGGDVLGFNVVNYFSRQADKVLVAKFCGAVPVAYYDKAYSLLLMPVGQINGPLGSVSIPALSRLQNEPDRFRRYFLNAIMLVCSLSMPVIAAITLFADEVVRVWLGPEWASSADLFRLLAAAAPRPAPCLRMEAVTAITPQEHNGRGTPRSTLLITGITPRPPR
jgi:PST family polysaccharide transporter